VLKELLLKSIALKLRAKKVLITLRFKSKIIEQLKNTIVTVFLILVKILTLLLVLPSSYLMSLEEG
jgi:hypothetical protein